VKKKQQQQQKNKTMVMRDMQVHYV